MSNQIQKPITQLTDLTVSEVSLVDRGAIGEVFTVIKSEEGLVSKTIRQETDGKFYIYSEDEKKKLGGPFDTKEEADKKLAEIHVFANKDVKKEERGVCEKLTDMTGQEFVSVLNEMMKRFSEINNVQKGGSKDMGKDEVMAMINDVVGAAMDTVNKNFVTVNKAIDEVQKTLTEEEKKEEKKEEEKKEEVSEVAKAVADIGMAVKTLTESFGTVAEQVTKLSEAKTDEKVLEVAKRVEKMENQENSSNSIDDVKKNDEPKKVFWKSFLAPTENN